MSGLKRRIQNTNGGVRKVKNDSSEKIAQWVIDNRYSKSEKQKVSDLEMYHEIIDRIKRLKQEVIPIDSRVERDDYEPLIRHFRD